MSGDHYADYQVPLSVFCFQFSVFSFQFLSPCWPAGVWMSGHHYADYQLPLSVFSFQFSAFSFQLSVVSFQLLVPVTLLASRCVDERRPLCRLSTSTVLNHTTHHCTLTTPHAPPTPQCRRPTTQLCAALCAYSLHFMIQGIVRAALFSLCSWWEGSQAKAHQQFIVMASTTTTHPPLFIRAIIGPTHPTICNMGWLHGTRIYVLMH